MARYAVEEDRVFSAVCDALSRMDDEQYARFRRAMSGEVVCWQCGSPGVRYRECACNPLVRTTTRPHDATTEPAHG